MTDYIGNYKNRPRRVVFYGRVSTEHEEQLSALGNQMEWYTDLALRNPNWTVVAQYIDEGITGTQMKKRPSFMRMIEHAKEHRFDLIVTRELSRFARNTVDALNATRELKQYGVEVYFVNDGIWTMDGDGEVRLTIMASIAQDESRKTSERVKAGQKMSREKGVLYGSGNIIGYDRVDGTYVINEEQAATVRRIFNLYAEGHGETTVAKMLIEENRKDGGGGLSWTASKVSRVLRKPTYKGYMTYNKSHIDDFLSHNRINHSEEDFVLVKGNFEPIVSEALWETCNQIRSKRAAFVKGKDGRAHKFGVSFPQNKWTKILFCDCGMRFQIEGYDKTANGGKNMRLICARSKMFKKKDAARALNGIPCPAPYASEWKLELMAREVFRTVWKENAEDILGLLRMLDANLNTTGTPNDGNQLENKLSALNEELDDLVSQRASRSITMDDFLSRSTEINNEIINVEGLLQSSIQEQRPKARLDMHSIEAALSDDASFPDGKIEPGFLDRYANRIVKSNNRYIWMLQLVNVQQIMPIQSERQPIAMVTYKSGVPYDIEQVLTLADALSRIRNSTGQKFIVIIDEWDILIRDEATNKAVQEEYIYFLRGLFKGTEPTKYIQLAYLTGILPIKKEKTQSALNNFDEFTMVSASTLAPFIGFTEEEVKNLCEEYHKDFDKVKKWYDGYLLRDYQVYNPRAVVSVMLKGEFKSYWSETASYEAIVPLINMNYDGLKTAIIEMLSGGEVKVNTATFKNDTVNIQSKDDVLTYMIHLGYLGYDQNRKTAFVPNEEIRQELTLAVESKHWNEMLLFQQESEKLLDATLDMDGDAVATQVEKIHDDYVSAIQYNNENSLSSVLAIAYLSAMQYYFKPVRELPTGRGFADFVFVPKPEYRNDYPALVVKLKWNQTAETAMQQIKEKKYPDSLRGYTGNLLLVAINYDKKTKKHQCLIEKVV